MVYIRRYLSGQQATTVVIAEGAITSDKIVDGAVTHPKIAVSAVDSERVVDGSLKSEDIQDGQIKTVDLAPNAVTTEKILDGAVTTQKLEVSIQGIARPLTPGVDTAEIQDGKVTLAKLAPDSVDASKIKSGAVGPTELDVAAVEESRVKDGAISRDKIAGGAIDTTKIGVGEVKNTDLADLSVSVEKLAAISVSTAKIQDSAVTTDKINLAAVTGIKILDGVITGPKIATAALARRHINSFRSSFTEHGESFAGGGISDKWVKTLSIGGVIYLSNDKGLLIKSGSGAGWPSRLDFGGQTIGRPGTIRPIMDIWITERNIASKLTSRLGLWNDISNYIAFYANENAGIASNWFAHCQVGGALTSIDTGVEIGTGVQLLSIDVVDDTHVFFYINGSEVAEINTNIPDAVDVEPYLSLESRAPAEDKNMLIKYVSLLLINPALP